MNTNLNVQKSVVLTLAFLLVAAMLLISQLYLTGITGAIGAGPNLYPQVKFEPVQTEVMEVVEQIGTKVEAYAPLGGRRTPAALEGRRTPAALEGRKTPAALEGRKTPAALEGRKLPPAAQVVLSAQQVTPLTLVDSLLALALVGLLLSPVWQVRSKRN
ncbi:MAG: hypothetical protein IPM39_11735 [Chloroflexi bacterium]|nr:hypothetical protein [Chloroflexota bacterium]